MTPEEFLSRPIYSWDVSNLLGGVVDFLDFSERNLAWQRRREVLRAEREAAELEFEPEDAHFLGQAREQIIQSAEYRFDLGLSQAVRQAGLVAYVTAMEWCSRLFLARLSGELPKRPTDKNKDVHLFEHLGGKSGSDFTTEIEQLQLAIWVRNCVVHSAGQIKGDRYEAQIRQALVTVRGFSLTTENFIGEAVHIDAGAVDALARNALEWVPVLDERCSNNGTFKATSG